MASFFKSRSAASSRRSSIAETRPTNSQIFTEPAPGCGPKKTHTYTADQQAMIDELQKHATTLLLPESDPYHVWEKRFISDPGFSPRYMRASKWKMDNAKQRIKGTLEWRRDYKPELILESDVSPEAETGKIILNGFDIDGRPILYMRPGAENTERSPRQIRHLIFHLERAIDFMPPGVETVVIIVDYKSATSNTNPSISTARQVLNILQNHYVERMGRAIVVNMPWWVNAFFTGITPFLDPVTKDKMRFNPNLPELVPVSQLDIEFGGENNFKFDHPIYWKTLVDFCHLAADGGRVDQNGQPCIPPLGKGAKAAFEELANSNPARTSGEDHTAVSSSAAQTPTRQANFAEQQTKSPQSDDLHAGMQNLSVNPAPGFVGASSTFSPTDITRGSTDTFASAKETLSVEDAPVVPTAEGPPAGAIVFDHPPTEAEQKHAEKLTNNVNASA